MSVIIHRGADGLFVKSFPPYQGYDIGYKDFVCQMDTDGGQKGANLEIPIFYENIKIGHTLIWIKDNVNRYSGIVSENNKGKIILKGTAYEEVQRAFDWTGTVAADRKSVV